MSLGFHKLAARISVVNVVQLSSMLGVILLVAWATFQPSLESGIMRHTELCITNMVLTSLADPVAFAEEAESLAALGVSFAVYTSEGALVSANASPPIPPLPPVEVGRIGTKTQMVRRDALPVFARTMRLPTGQTGQVLFSPPPFAPPLLALLPGFLLALVASASGAVLLARSFARPLTQLTDAAHRLGSGDLSARTELRRRDEFGQLAAAFDDMAERLGTLVRAQQELLANVSHELRTPLARIRVALDVAHEADGAIMREALADITEDLAELERLVADVLQTARLDLAAGRLGPQLPFVRRERVRLEDLLDKACARFRAQHPRRQLELVMDEELPPLIGDPILLRRALDNVIDNAQKYSESASPISVHVSRDGGEVSVCVRDRGIGISPEDLPQIAQPFFRTDRSRARKTGGLGLGLSLSRRIVEAHGGRLQIESQLNVGTSVLIALPVERARVSEAASAATDTLVHTARLT